MSICINHVTLTTGHNRASPRDEVRDEILSALYPWLEQVLEAGAPTPLPAESLAHYSAKATREDIGLVLTVYAPRGPHIKGKPHKGEMVPIVTMGLAQRPDGAAVLWQQMIDVFGAAPGTEMPPTPWCAIAPHPALIQYQDAAEWLGDFERCVAWAWITRNPALDVVNRSKQ